MTATFDATDFESEMYDPDAVDMIPATSEGKPEHYPVDISTKAFWNQTSEQREETFKVLRREQPVSWQRPVDDAVTPDPDDPGYWAVVSHADILKVSGTTTPTSRARACCSTCSRRSSSS